MHNGQIGYALRPLSQKVWALCFPHMPKLVISYATLEGRGEKCMSCIIKLQPWTETVHCRSYCVNLTEMHIKIILCLCVFDGVVFWMTAREIMWQ